MTAHINYPYHQHHLSCWYQCSWLRQETKSVLNRFNIFQSHVTKRDDFINVCHRTCKNDVYNRECQFSLFQAGCIIWPWGVKFWCTSPPLIENALISIHSYTVLQYSVKMSTVWKYCPVYINHAVRSTFNSLLDNWSVSLFLLCFRWGTIDASINKLGCWVSMSQNNCTWHFAINQKHYFVALASCFVLGTSKIFLLRLVTVSLLSTFVKKRAGWSCIALSCIYISSLST